MKGSGEYVTETVTRCYELARHHVVYGSACRDCIAQAIEDAVRAEREACALIADTLFASHYDHSQAKAGARQVAAEIRSRGATPDPTPEERKR